MDPIQLEMRGLQLYLHNTSLNVGKMPIAHIRESGGRCGLTDTPSAAVAVSLCRGK